MSDFITTQLAAVYKPMVDIPYFDSLSETAGAIAGNGGSFAEMVNGLFKIAISVGAMLAVFMFIWGGIMMITATDNASKVTKGKEKMKNAVIGLVLLLSVYVVLDTINPQLTTLDATGSVVGKIGSGNDKFPKTKNKPRVVIADPKTQQDLDEYWDSQGVANISRRCLNYFNNGGHLTAQQKAQCEDWKRQVELDNTLHDLVNKTEKRWCPYYITSKHNPDRSDCYLSKDTCENDTYLHGLAGKNDCREAYVYTLNPVKDGVWILNENGYNTSKYATEEICKAVAGASPTNASCIEGHN